MVTAYERYIKIEKKICNLMVRSNQKLMDSFEIKFIKGKRFEENLQSIKLKS